MRLATDLVLALCGYCLTWSTTSTGVLASKQDIEADVCVIGGGSSGTYAAIRLQQEGKKVVLIEKENRLGGHVNTYVDPKTGETYDYGVVVFGNTSVVRNYFNHFNVPLVALPTSGSGVSITANFKTGTEVPSSQLIGGNATEALLKYREQIDKFLSIYDDWGGLQYPVAEELLMDFGRFIKKYGLEALAYEIFSYNQGVGNILAQPTLYMMKYLDTFEVTSLLNEMPGNWVVNAKDDNQLLYDRALQELGSNAFLNSNITRVTRHHDCVIVCFDTPDGEKTVRAKKLVISIPPTLSNLNFLDLDEHDQSLFAQWNNSYYWDSLIKNSGIPDNTSFSNVDPAAALNLPALPGIYGFGATPIKNVHTAYYSSPNFMTDDEVKADILATLAQVRSGLGYPAPAEPPEFVGFNLHAPFNMEVSKEAYKNGFYKRLNALQGKKNTWWTGAAWLCQASTSLWDFNERKIVPGVLAG